MTICVDCSTGKAEIIDSLNPDNSRHESAFYWPEAVEKMLSAIFQTVCHINDRHLPVLEVKHQKLARIQGSMDCGPCSLMYASACLEMEPSLSSQLTYTDALIRKLRVAHWRIYEDHEWINPLKFRFDF